MRQANDQAVGINKAILNKKKCAAGKGHTNQIRQKLKLGLATDTVLEQDITK